MVEPAVATPEAAYLVRGEAERLVRSLFEAPGFRGRLRRMSNGSPDGPVWSVEATNVITGQSARLRSRDDWLRFRASCVSEERRIAAPEGPPRGGRPRKHRAPTQEPAPTQEVEMPSENGTVVDIQATSSTPVQAEAPADYAHAAVDFTSWEQLTRAAADRAQADVGSLERRLESLHSEMLRMRDELRAALTVRRREVVLLRRALGLAAGTPGPDPTTGTVRHAKSETSRAKAQREVTHGQLLSWARGHGGELVLRDFREASTLYASSIYRALTGVKGLVTTGLMEKVEPGRYRLAAPRAEVEA